MKSKFAKYVSLNVIGMIGISLYILADTFFISQAMGSDGIAALNFCLSVYSIMHGLGLMLGIGGAARCSILRGLGRNSEAEAVFMNTLYMGAFFAVILSLTGTFFSTEISLLLGADEYTIAHSEVYMTTMLCFSPCFIMNNIMLAFVRNDGNPKICMTAMLVSSISNIILDMIFIFILSMGMYGAVFATGISPIISLSVLTLHLKSSRCTIKLTRQKPDIKRMLSLSQLGLSSFITELSSAVTIIAYNLVILKISGNTGLAAYGIVANTALVAASVFSGISQGIQPIASEEAGNSNASGLKNLLKYTITTTLIVSAAIFVSVYLSAPLISDFFNSEKNPELNNIASNGLRIYFIGYIFAGLNIVLSVFFSAVDKAKKAFAVSFARSAAVIVPVLLILSLFFKENGVWLAFPAVELLAFVIGMMNIKI